MALARYQVVWLVCCWLSSASASDPRGSLGAEAPAIDRLASMRVGELQHLLSQTNSKCPGCVEKGDYVRRCQQVWQELRRAPATVHVVSSEFDTDLQEASEYEWLSGPYDVTEPNSSWVIRDWRRPRYERRRCPASVLARYGSCPVLEHGTAQTMAGDAWEDGLYRDDIAVQALLGGPSWTGWVVSQTRDAHASPNVWYHRAASDALLPQDIVSTPWKYDNGRTWARSKLVRVLAGDVGRVAWEKTQRTARQFTDERGRTGLLRAACNGKPLDEARGCLRDGRAWDRLEYPATPIDARDDQGRTALMCAAELGNAPLAHVLLQAGANPKLEDSEEYRTARELAAEAGHHALAAMLADRMAVGRSSSSAWRPSAAEEQLAVGFVNLTNFSARCGLFCRLPMVLFPLRCLAPRCSLARALRTQSPQGARARAAARA